MTRLWHPARPVNVLGFSSLAGFQLTAYGRFKVTTEVHGVIQPCQRLETSAICESVWHSLLARAPPRRLLSGTYWLSRGAPRPRLQFAVPTSPDGRAQSPAVSSFHSRRFPSGRRTTFRAAGQRLGLQLIGRFSTDHLWPVLGDHRGSGDSYKVQSMNAYECSQRDWYRWNPRHQPPSRCRQDKARKGSVLVTSKERASLPGAPRRQLAYLHSGRQLRVVQSRQRLETSALCESVWHSILDPRRNTPAGHGAGFRESVGHSILTRPERGHASTPH